MESMSTKSEATSMMPKEIMSIENALKQLKANATAKFTEKVDISLQTGIDARK